MAVAIRVATRPHARARLEALAVRIVAAFRHALVRAVLEAAAPSRKRATEFPGATERALAAHLLVVARILDA
jgi:hypothetical protein